MKKYIHDAGIINRGKLKGLCKEYRNLRSQTEYNTSYTMMIIKITVNHVPPAFIILLLYRPRGTRGECI